MVIDNELGIYDHSSIPSTAIGRSWNHLIPKLTPNQIKLVVKVKKIKLKRNELN
jgi:hypothetical protein